MKKVLIFGNSMFSKEIYNVISKDIQNYEVLGFTLDKEYTAEKTFCGLENYDFNELTSYYNRDDYEIILSVGYSRMNDLRKQIYDRCIEKKYNIGTYIHPSAIVFSKKIGVGNIVSENVILRHDTILGDCNFFGYGTFISHDCAVGDFNYYALNVNIAGNVKMGNNNFFGVGSVVSNDLSIGNYNIIGAAGCVDRNIDENTVITPPPNRYVTMPKRRLEMLLR